jgi:hypothetical protein
MNENVLVNEKYRLVRDRCSNYNESCLEWAMYGGCDTEPEKMNKKCGPICQNCDYYMSH